jgi:uncharacterized protein (TIGR02145 family)
MKKLLILLITFTFATELEVDGDLKVTGNIQAGTIDSLQIVIEQQQQRISTLEILMNYLIQNFDIPYDCNTTYEGTAILDINGDCCEASVIDICNVCNGDNSTCLTTTDIDGNIYASIQIGDQIWMAENLKTTHYRNGESLLFGTQGSGSGSYHYPNNDPTNVELYGNLYNYDAASDERGVCPEGWHVPSIEDFYVLVADIGGEWDGISSEAGGKLKDSGLDYWDSPNTGATNESGFTALPAGGAHSDTHYPYFGETAKFWATNYSGDNILSLNHNSIDVTLSREGALHEGNSIRCIQD